ncbi:MAG: carbon-nitrogen hydrolase family protein [Gammaproteobacteria bacterium]
MPQIALIQTTSGSDIDANLARAAELVEEARAGGAAVVALPECFALMPKNAAQLRECAEIHGDGKIQRFLAELARRAGVWILAGTVPLRAHVPQRVFNSSLVYNAAGENVARYDKIHLFDADLRGARAKTSRAASSAAEQYRESAYTAAGAHCVVQSTPLGAVGLSVCYDLRFPELYRKLVALGAVCLAAPSAFACATGAAHWETLLRARAIENACYVFAAAQVGAHCSGRRTFGHSAVIGPWGEVVAMRADAPGLLRAEIDAARIAEARARLPSWSQRRPHLFA